MILSLLARLVSPVRRDLRRDPGVGRAFPSYPASWLLFCSLCLVVLGMVAGGCGSSSVGKAGTISVTLPGGSASGQVTSLQVSTSVNVSMTPTGGAASAGVDWTVTCGGSPTTGSVTGGACGTLSPIHTASGAAALFTAPGLVPLGKTVTLLASVTGNPSLSSSVTLTVLPSPVAVSLTLSPTVTSIQESGVLTYQATVTNDTTKAGVTWAVTCGSSDCGSLSSTTTSNTKYTAPAFVPVNNTVTITATSIADTTKSASSTVTIVTPTQSDPIAVSVSPAIAYVTSSGQTRTAKFTATVINDSASKGVTWTVTCSASSCGQPPSASASGAAASYLNTSTVPVNGTVTLRATSVSDPTKSATATVTVVSSAPGTVTLSPAPSSMLVVNSQASIAATTPDSSSVAWSATCFGTGACGSFSSTQTASGATVTYTAPATIPSGGVVAITASSTGTTPSNSALALITIVAQPPVVSFSQSPPSALTAGAQTAVSATVTNDVAPGGVTWTLQCGSTVAGACGAIVPYQTASGGIATYTAPPATSAGTSVTITATSTADPSVSKASSPIAINPSTALSIGFVPAAPTQVQANGTVNLNAAVSNDSTDAGVDWQVCASGCGYFTTKPAISATSTTPYVPAVTATSVTAWPNGLLLPYTAPSQPPSSGSVGVVVAAHADAAVNTSSAITITSASSGPALHGTVLAGVQPVAGASVALYAAGTTGYHSASLELYAPGASPAVTTDSSGTFTIPAGYSCPQSNSQVYLVATGGKVGANDPNNDLSLMTALGSCSGLGSSPVVVNEVTTVASAWALAPFASNDAITGNSSYLYIGSSSGNLAGLANAFAAVHNLVNISTGNALYTVPAGNATVPYAEINTMADILNTCTATSGGAEGDGSPCGNLLAYADPLAWKPAYNGISPTDTLQAAFNIAQHPATGYGYQIQFTNLFPLATLASPFQPILTAQPNDWSISLNYTSGGGLSPASTVGSFAIDSSGYLWITDTKAGSVIEWNAVGAAISPSSGFPAGGGPIAIDATGDVWISGDGSLTELTNLGDAAQGSPFSGLSGGGIDAAFDAQSNLWITNSEGVAEFSSLGVEVSPINGYTNSGVAWIGPVAIDSSNNVWVNGANATDTQSYLAELSNAGGQLIVNAQNGNGYNGVTVTGQIAADGSGDIWSTLYGVGGICKMPPYGGSGTVLIAHCYPGGNSQSSVLSIVNAQGIAMDGAGTVWAASKGDGKNYLPNVISLVPSLIATSNAGTFVSSSLSAGTLRVAVDGSGNVWVLLANNTVTEYVGLATPVVTPIALGVQNKKLGAKP